MYIKDRNIKLVYEWHEYNKKYNDDMKDCVVWLKTIPYPDRDGVSFFDFIKRYIVS